MSAPGRGPTRYDLDRAALAEVLADQPSYRVDQVWEGLHGQLRHPAELTNVPAVVRQRIDDAAPAALRPVVVRAADDGATTKWLHELRDGTQIETVLMHYAERVTVCVSTQAGCAMACGFCATGQAGFDRHLSTGEIVEQVVVAARAAAPRRVSNVVFMGMGEPLANYDATWAAVERLQGPMGISARHLTLSTVGIVPGIRRLAAEALPVNLAVSLHAANDADRDALVPINRRYPLDELMTACEAYVAAKRRRLSFEWALIADVNDQPRHADELAALCRPLRAHVNVIPLNPTPGYLAIGSPTERVRRFCNRLRDAGVNVTVRDTRGRDIDAACGQLRADHQP